MHSHLSLERITGPLPPPEYVSCPRCDRNRENDGSVSNLCPDCRIADKIVAHQQRKRGAVHNSDPSFEITIHYSGNTNVRRLTGGSNPTRQGINKAGFTYITCNVDDDPVAREYVENVLGHYWWPVVTVTSYGRLLAHWEGTETEYFPNRYSQLQGLYEQVQTRTVKPIVLPTPMHQLHNLPKSETPL